MATQRKMKAFAEMSQHECIRVVEHMAEQLDKLLPEDGVAVLLVSHQAPVSCEWAYHMQYSIEDNWRVLEILLRAVERVKERIAESN